MHFYNYDCNGNRLTRVENGVSYAQGWNQENRLQTVTVNGATTTFTYDGDGKLVKKTTPDGMTYYVNALYELYIPQESGGTQAMAMTEPAVSAPAALAEPIAPVDAVALSPTLPEKAPSSEANAIAVTLPRIYMLPEPTYTAGSSNTVEWQTTTLPPPGIDPPVEPMAYSPLSTIEFQVRRASDAVCTSGVVDSPWLSGKSYTFTGLSHNTRYYYCARARRAGVTSAWSSSVYSTQDAVAPTAQMGALSSVQSQLQFTVSWSGSDSGSGVKNYDVQVQINGGAWQTWKSATTATSATYSGAYGNTYAFRVRARDQVDNQGVWSAVVTTTMISIVKYYYFGSQRVAMRGCAGTNGSCRPNSATSTLSYLHADHLGSASLSTNATGGKVSEMRYYPYGEMRSGAMATDRQYTGQRREIGLGLYDYNARYYDPLLGRFLSADSIVPGAASGSGGGAATLGYDSNTRLTPLTVNLGEFAAQINAENREVLQFGAFFQWDSKTRQEHNVPMGPANPQALNRYAYCLNNPLRYIDPSGHWNLEVGLSASEADAIIKLGELLDNVEITDAVLFGGGLGLLKNVLEFAGKWPTKEQNAAEIAAAIETIRTVNPSLALFLSGLGTAEAGLFFGSLAVVAGADLAWTAVDISKLAGALDKIDAGTYGATLSLKGCLIYKITATNQNGSKAFRTAVIGPWGSLVVPYIGTQALLQ